MGYYPGYLQSSCPPATVDYASLTHLAVGPVLPLPDAGLDTTFSVDPTNGPALAHDLVTRAHTAGIKAIAMIGGAGAHDGFAAAASSGSRAAFEQSLLQLVSDYGFDGLDLDWEPVSSSDQPLISALASDLKAANGALVLTMPVDWTNSNFGAADSWYGTISAQLDQLNLMTYEMSGTESQGWTGWQSWYFSAVTGETANTPSSVSSSASAYEAAGVPASKLGVGVGFYGQCWQGVSAPFQSTSSATIVASDNVMTNIYIQSAYYSAGAYSYDTSAQAPSLSFPGGHGTENCNWVTYEDATSIAAKGAWAKSAGLGGAIIWNINEGCDPSASNPNALLQATRAAFH